jgi:peptidyl-prolyl cis-trans isomerase A (cyclophilin A)/peptidyl-prolyl cis-trans isomerase B (cyclophilin B)
MTSLTTFFAVLFISLFSLHGFASDKSINTASKIKPNPQVVLHTTRGEIAIELYPDKAPLTVANFLDYAKSGHYDGMIFHRVIRNFMIQTGGYTEDFAEKATKPPILNESKNGLHNERWMVAMARKNDPDSASSQFFINLKMNTNLDYQQGKPGYAVFGKVIDGQFVVKSISMVPTTGKNGFQDVPIENIVIERVTIK